MLRPSIHIIGLGGGRLDRLSLAVYRVLQKANRVYVLTEKHPAVQDMLAEGFRSVEIITGSQWNARGDILLEEVVGNLADRVLDQEKMNGIVIGLPGNPLREGRFISALEPALKGEYDVDTSLLAGDGTLERLTAIMADLRSPLGCAWDREQNHETLKRYLIEETYEVIEAIDAKNMYNFCEELGDLLLQVVFHAQIAEETSAFNIQDVLKGISEKLIRRHPHVFGSVIADSSEDVLVNWEAIKKSEKAKLTGDDSKQTNFFNMPRGLPALQMAEDTQKKASKVGFDWEDYQGPLAKIYEELGEIQKELGQNHRLKDELGDLLFSVVNLSRFLGVNAEDALRQGTKKFQDRFNKMVVKIQKERLDLQDLSLEQMDFYWDEVKKEENNGTFVAF